MIVNNRMIMNLLKGSKDNNNKLLFNWIFLFNIFVPHPGYEHVYFIEAPHEKVGRVESWTDQWSQTPYRLRK